MNHDDANDKHDNHKIDDDKEKLLPLYKQIILDKENYVLYAPENLAKAFNYSDWDQLIDLMNKHSDPNLITTLRAWNGMKLIGIDMNVKYLSLIHI